MADPQEGKPDASSALPSSSEEPDGAPSLNESDKYAADRRLPVVVVPRLDGGDAVMPPAVEAFVEMSPARAKEEAGASSAGAAAPAAVMPAAAMSWRWRFALLAGGFVLATGLGSFVGSWSASGWAQLWEQAPAKHAAAGEMSVLQATRVEMRR